jgi:poly(3-hydroxybutyrate) depolymerase
VRRAVLATVFLAAALRGQPRPLGPPYAIGPQSITFLSDVDDTDQPYSIYLPRGFDESRKYPLIISLHEDGSNHRLNLRRVFGRGNRVRETDSQAANGPFPPFPSVDWIVAAPLARGTMGYQGIAEKDVYDVLADVEKRFPIDADRIYLTGISMGGGGALRLALTRPDVWAAVAVVCPAELPDAQEFASNTSNLPARVFAGALDPVVPAGIVRGWRKDVQELGTPVEYTEYPMVKHTSWNYAYQGGTVFNWFAGFKRERFPARVRFTSRSYKYRAAYWVELDGLTPGNLASIDAKFTARNEVEVQTAGLDGFTLHPAGHLMYAPGLPVSVRVDGSLLKVASRGALSFAKTPKGWRAEPYVRPDNSKGPGQEGPIAEAVSRRHLYVYGTADSAEEGELARRRAQAEFAANWGDPLQPMLLSLRTVSDREVSETSAHNPDLVLFGTKETNSEIARLASALPIELHPGAADFGLVFIAPAGGRYVLVNSGLPFWTGAEVAKRAVSLFTPPIYQTLLSFGDFILFKGSLRNVVAEGRFERNWKVPAEQAAKMASTGAVQLR